MFSWCVSNSNRACNSMGKTVQLFHDMFTKGVNQLLGDPNCDASQWSGAAIIDRLHEKTPDFALII